jgi:hypothetical protein
MRCRDFVAGLLLAGAGRRRATRRREQQHVGCNQATTEISLPHWTDGARAPPHGAASLRPTNVPLWHLSDMPTDPENVC